MNKVWDSTSHSNSFIVSLGAVIVAEPKLWHSVKVLVGVTLGIFDCLLEISDQDQSLLGVHVTPTEHIFVGIAVKVGVLQLLPISVGFWQPNSEQI